MQSPLFAALVAAIWGVCLYSESLWFGYVYDDVPVVANDERLQDPQFLVYGWWDPWWASTDSLGESRPLTAISFWVQTQLHGKSPFEPHVANVLLFGVLTYLVAVTAAHWLRRNWAAWPVGLIFASHPIHVEVVVNLVGRAETLSALFSVAAILSWLRWRLSMNWPRSVGIAVLVLLAGQSKETGYLSAGVILLGEIGERHCNREQMMACRGFLPLLCGFSMVAAYGLAQRTLVAWRMNYVYGVSSGEVDSVLNPLVASDWRERFVTPLKLLGKAVQLLFVPVNQSHDYSPQQLMPEASIASPLVILGAMTVGLWLLGLVFTWQSRSRALGPLLACAVAWIVPSNSFFLIGVIFAERLLMMVSIFLPMALVELIATAYKTRPPNDRAEKICAMCITSGFLAFVVAMLFQIDRLQSIGITISWVSRTAIIGAIAIPAAWGATLIASRKSLSVALIVVVFGYSSATLCYGQLWCSTNTLMIANATRHPENGRLQGVLSTTLIALSTELNREFYDVAEDAANQAIRLCPRHPNPYIALACLAQRNGDQRRAVELVELCVKYGWDLRPFEPLLNQFGLDVKIQAK